MYVEIKRFFPSMTRELNFKISKKLDKWFITDFQCTVGHFLIIRTHRDLRFSDHSNYRMEFVDKSIVWRRNVRILSKFEFNEVYCITQTSCGNVGILLETNQIEYFS